MAKESREKRRKGEGKERRRQRKRERNNLDMGLRQSDPGEVAVLCFSCKSLV